MTVNPKENLLALMSGAKDAPLLNEWEAFAPVFGDPINMYLKAHRKQGHTSIDRFGSEYVWQKGDLSGMVHVTKDNKVIPDIKNWRETLAVPDLNAVNGDWSEVQARKAQIEAEGRQLSLGIMVTGLFEQLHALMGFEDTLMNFLRRPKEMIDLCEVLGEYRLGFARLLVENLKPDVILSHDDWGTKHQLFMNPKTFRQFIKPQYMKLYGYLKDNGVIVMHHSDSFAQTIVPDMIEMGVDIWQGALPENDIPAIIREYGRDITIMGGIDASVVDRIDSTEEEIRAEVRRACREYGPCGHFIPAMTYGGPNFYLFPHVQQYVVDEISRYNLETYPEVAEQSYRSAARACA